MKQIASNYTYNKTSGVIVLSGLTIDRDQLLLIVNTTRNVTYYNFADSTTTLQAFTQGANTSVTLASSVISASSAHNNADALTIYYDDQISSGAVTANCLGESWEEHLTLKPNIEDLFGGGVGLLAVGGQTYADPLLIPPIHVVSKAISDLTYIKAGISVNKTGESGLFVSIFLRRISEYKYESVRYQGNEDEAYITIELVTPAGGGSQKIWKASYLGGYADWTGYFAYALPQNKGYHTGDPFPPTAWTLEAGFTGTMTVSYEQPSTQPISGTVNAALATENDFVVIGEEINQGFKNNGAIPISGTDLGAKADAVATTDTGTFSVIAFIKRGLQNWTSLLAKIPTLVSGRIPVDGSGVTQPVSLASVPTHGVTGTFWQTTQPISGTVTANTGLTQPLTDTQLRATSVPVSLASLPSLTAGSAQIGSVSIALSTAGVVTTFTSITSATLIASNSSRKMLTIQNTGAGILYVLFGSGTASSTNFSVQMNSGDFYENDYYSGQMNAIFATAGTAYVTSLT